MLGGRKGQPFNKNTHTATMTVFMVKSSIGIEQDNLKVVSDKALTEENGKLASQFGRYGYRIPSRIRKGFTVTRPCLPVQIRDQTAQPQYRFEICPDLTYLRHISPLSLTVYEGQALK